MSSYQPLINVQVTPEEVKKGQLIHIFCTITDQYQTPIFFKNVYMQIIDSKGIEVWPFSVIDTNSSGFSKMISTSEMRAGMKYTIRVSVSKSLRPQGSAVFSIEKKRFPKFLLAPALLLIPDILLSHPDDTGKEKENSDIIQPKRKVIKIEWLVFVTQKDSRVCKYCMAYADKQYRPQDPDLPKIPVHFSCRCNFDVISTEDSYEAYYDAINLQRNNMQNIITLYSINETVKSWNTQAVKK